MQPARQPFSAPVLARLARLALLAALAATAACGREAAPADATPKPAVTPAAASTPAAEARTAPEPAAGDAVRSAMRAFRALRSYHATMDMEGAAEGPMHNEFDYVAPDRYRMTMEARGVHLENVRIGNDMYMTMDGRTHKVTMPPQAMDKWEDLIEQGQATMTTQAAGRETIDGASLRKYLARQAEPQPADITLWLNDDDLPVQARMTTDHEGRPVTTTIRYSRYNDPGIVIEPPQ